MNGRAAGPKPTALSRADLLICLAQFDLAGLQKMASFYGYEQPGQKQSSAAKKSFSQQTSRQVVVSDSIRDDESGVTSELADEKFYYVKKHRSVATHEIKTIPPDWFEESSEFSEPIKANPHTVIPALLPLLPWARLWPFLRRVLGATYPGRQLDVDALVKQMAQGRSLRRLSYRARNTWAFRCQLIVDYNPRLWPFFDDFNRLCEQLSDLRGAHGLDILTFTQGPEGKCRPWRDRCANDVSYALPEAGTPVLILSDLGSLSDEVDVRRVWQQWGRRMRAAGLKPVVLMPCPPRLWHQDLVPYFYHVCWDRGYRLPRQWQASRHLPRVDDEALDRVHGVAELLTLLAPAIRIEPALLRAARYLLPLHAADVASEAMLWMHHDVVATATVLAYHPQAIHKYRRALQQQVSKAQAGGYHPWTQVGELLQQYHGHLSPAIIDEEQRNCRDLLGELVDSYDVTFIQQMVKTLFANPQDYAMRGWVKRMGSRLLSESWQQYEPLAVAWAKVYQEALTSGQTITLPAGFDVKLVAWVLGQFASSGDYVLKQVSQTLILSPPEVETTTVFSAGSPIAKLSLSARQLQWQQELQDDAQDSPVKHHMAVDDTDNTSVTVPLPANGSLQIFTDHHELTIDTMQKPAWASAIGRDALGLFVEFVEGQGKRRAYWVNPGLYPVKNRDGVEIGSLPIKSGYFQDEQQFRLFVEHGLQQPDWADEIGLDDYGLYVSFSIKGVSQVMRWIMPGEFKMGSPESEAERGDDELLHEVILTKAYWLADTACTQALWQVVMGENPSGFKNNLNPLDNVSWKDAMNFINRLNKKQSDLELRLPTEAEWEYACRVGTSTPFSFGENISPELVNYDGNYPYAGGAKGLDRGQTVQVKALPCNAWGLYQMHGNVWEWCVDGYDEYPNRALIDPQGPDEATGRVLRGGSWFNYARFARSAARFGFVPGNRYDGTGLRLARG